jgi:hypothetical protein
MKLLLWIVIISFNSIASADINRYATGYFIHSGDQILFSSDLHVIAASVHVLFTKTKLARAICFSDQHSACNPSTIEYKPEINNKKVFYDVVAIWPSPKRAIAESRMWSTIFGNKLDNLKSN